MVKYTTSLLIHSRLENQCPSNVQLTSSISNSALPTEKIKIYVDPLQTQA
jgi:hypothetical protein